MQLDPVDAAIDALISPEGFAPGLDATTAFYAVHEILNAGLTVIRADPREDSLRHL